MKLAYKNIKFSTINLAGKIIFPFNKLFVILFEYKYY